MGIKIIEERLSDKFKDPLSTGHVTEILKDKGKAPTFLHELIDSPYDCDKLDYLMRDAHHTGIEYGVIDCTRILEALRVHKLSLCISKTALDALMSSFYAIQLMYTTVYYHKTSRIFDFIVADALEEIPEYVEEIITDVNKFLSTDDMSLIYDIRKRAEQGSDSYRRASSLLDSYLKRDKIYKEISEHPLSLGTAIRKDARVPLSELEDELLKKAENADLKIKIDYRPEIRPVGVTLEELDKWLREPRIFDSEDKENPVKSLNEPAFHHYCRSLRRYVILFRVFAQRDQCDGREKKIDEHAKRGISQIEEQFRDLA